MISMENARLTRIRRDAGRGLALAAGIALGAALGAALVVVLATRLFGFRVLEVASDSMAPSLHRGDLVVSRPVSIMDVERGDVIVFEEGTQTRVLVVHRIAGIVNVTVNVTDSATGAVNVERTRLLRTQGDANPGPDGDAVDADRLRGVVWFSVPHAGWLFGDEGPRATLTLAAILLGVAWAGYEAASILRRKRGGPRGGSGSSFPPANTDPSQAVGPVGSSSTWVAHRRRTRTGGRRSFFASWILALGIAFVLVPSVAGGWTSSVTGWYQAAVGTVESVRASVDVEPESLRVESQGVPVMVVIRLPNADISAIDVPSIRLCGGISSCGSGGVPATDPMWSPDGQVLTLRFSRANVIVALASVDPPADVAITVSGTVGGHPFAGADVVRIIGGHETPSPTPSGSSFG